MADRTEIPKALQYRPEIIDETFTQTAPAYGLPHRNPKLDTAVSDGAVGGASRSPPAGRMRGGMRMQYTVGMNRGGRSEQAAVDAEDALAAALQAKQQFPEAMITYVRKRNERGDRRHPHRDLSKNAAGKQRSLRSPGQEQENDR